MTMIPSSLDCEVQNFLPPRNQLPMA